MPQAMTLTKHGEARMRQRGLRDADLRLMMAAASQVAEDALLMTKQDVAREVERLRERIRQVERLEGVKVIVACGAVVTAYRPGQRNGKATLRRARALRIAG